ncbi:MAG: acyl-CoA thioesterase [Rikenellaceae bacterium]|nr:acyl-CoA thioesterase [Rikenellaceae bacterium]
MTETKIQMRFADTDMLGHINNINLQHYFDMGRQDYMRNVLRVPLVWDREGMIMASVETQYLHQTRFGDPVCVTTCVERLGNKSVTMFQRLLNEQTGRVHAECRAVVVAFDYGTQQTIPVPALWRARIEEYERNETNTK